MVENKKTKRERDIKSKLMAAIAMLLVSSIMMVSSTYAWFTLSTAPEVTGITTAVGANGNLEMALQPLDGDSSKITSAAGDSMAVQAAYLANTTWGNLVDLSDSSYYGLDKIMLYPAALNTSTDGTTIQASPLKTPEYGADGRVSELSTDSLTGVYDMTSKTFVNSETTQYGVRAVGTSSGMSDRQLAYRAAKNAASTAAGQGKKTASQALNNNGAKLGDIAIKHATTADGEDELYTVADMQALETMINALLGTDSTTGSLEYIEEALIQYALATALGDTTGVTDDNYASVVADFATVEITATTENLTTIMTKWGVTNASVTGYIDELQKSLSDVAAAKTIIDGLLYTDGTLVADTTTYEWEAFDDAVTALANPSKMQVNGIAVNDLKGNWKYDAATDGTLPTGYTTNDDGYVLDEEGAIVSNMSRLVDAVLNDGIQLIIASGAGVFADIADFCGDYSASVTLSKISYGGMTVKNLDANMSTKTSQTSPYLTQASTAVPAFNAGASTTASSSISDFYGYVIDLAFRTNVADSYLMLQPEGIDRIYSDGSNENTQGGGAAMTFTATTDTFSGAAVKSLMGCIRIVFFDSNTNVIKGYAVLDANSAETDSTTGSITMTMVMTDKDGKKIEDDAATTVNESLAIMALEQNTVHELSVLVYLDGEKVTNADVANAASSMTGSMNLQFSSSATLYPMDYSDLKAGEAGSLMTTTTLTNVTATGATVSRAVYDGTNVGIMLSGVTEGQSVTVNIGSTDYNTTVQSVNGYLGVTVAATGVTADTAITVTVATGD